MLVQQKLDISKVHNLNFHLKISIKKTTFSPKYISCEIFKNPRMGKLFFALFIAFITVVLLTGMSEEVVPCHLTTRYTQRTRCSRNINDGRCTEAAVGSVAISDPSWADQLQEKFEWMIVL